MNLTRAKRFAAALLAGVLCLSLLAGCAPKKKELTRYTTVFYDVFDTVTQVIAYCENEEEFSTQMSTPTLPPTTSCTTSTTTTPA